MNAKKLSKWLSASLAAAMVVGSLAACGARGGSSTKSTTGSTKSATGGSAKELTVTIWDSGQQPGLQEIINDFTAATGIKAKLQVVDWDNYWTLLEAGATGGELPDVFWMHSNESVKYMSNNMLLDLTDRIKASKKLEMNKFPSTLKDLYTFDGKSYAVPKDIDTIAVWYNKAMFDAAGLKYPDGSWTWDEFYETAKKLTKADGSQYGYAMNPSNNQDGWMNIVYSHGGTVLTDDKKSGFDQKETVEAMQFVDKLRKEVMPAANVMAETRPEVLFQSGKVAMISQGSWMVSPFKANEYLTKNADVARLPKDAKTGKSVSIYNGLGWAAAANTKMPDEAFALIEWLGSKENQEKQAKLGITMSAYEGVSSTWVNNTNLFNLKPYLDAMNGDLQIRPHTNATVTWEQGITDELTKAWNGQVSIEDACKAVTEMMNSKISQE
ncbi:MAG: sugar ABC transporter substrate-binding protein [Lachnospiraceae bacterium]|nr:sugar ABC transporter substrate-binding protein [Lachnospiraceae bacterium]MDY5742104.1 sugar ABC transporter substrate-binding protein [Lachnospiraceae bacterium]